MAIESLKDLMIEELQDLYGAEQQIVEALPGLIEAASDAALRRALKEHLQRTRGHVERLEQTLRRLGQTPEAKTCKGIAGILEEGAELAGKRMPPQVKDAALIAAAQKVEHYEMAAYGSVRAFAQQLDDLETAQRLQATLDEEGDSDRTLTHLAEFSVNLQAAGEVAAVHS